MVSLPLDKPHFHLNAFMASSFLVSMFLTRSHGKDACWCCSFTNLMAGKTEGVSDFMLSFCNLLSQSLVIFLKYLEQYKGGCVPCCIRVEGRYLHGKHLRVGWTSCCLSHHFLSDTFYLFPSIFVKFILIYYLVWHLLYFLYMRVCVCTCVCVCMSVRVSVHVSRSSSMKTWSCLYSLDNNSFKTKDRCRIFKYES